MKSKALKWLLIAVALVLLLAVAVVAAGYALAGRKMARRVELSVAPVALPADAAGLEMGRYLFNSRGCAECHGASGSGRKVIDGGGMLVVAPHIDPGPGSVTAA